MKPDAFLIQPDDAASFFHIVDFNPQMPVRPKGLERTKGYETKYFRQPPVL